MAFFRKKPDPLSDRARALNEEIARIEAQIKKLDSQVQKGETPAPPRLRSTALPHGTTVTHQSDSPPPASGPVQEPVSQEPIFEEVDLNRLKDRDEPKADTPGHFNDLGMRKYDITDLLRRAGNFFQGPSTTNPRLVSYLAAGGIQGLRPLRYEKRVARNRFFLLVGFLFFVLLGIAVYLRGR